MLEKPVIIKDVLEVDLFQDLWLEMNKYTKWSLTNFSYGKTVGDQQVSWGLMPKNDSILWYKAASIIKLKLLRHLRQKIQLCKLHFNAQTRGQISEFHKDFDEENCWTFVLFTESEWNTQWGGEFVSQHSITGEYFYVPYIPNSGALIPAHWHHYGMSPNAVTDKARTTIAFSYMAVDDLDKVLNNENHPLIDKVRKFV
tara:strand:- start:1253 stop:1849 length:597 start_codon:yes stop_codon:yes gene_type:complete